MHRLVKIYQHAWKFNPQLVMYLYGFYAVLYFFSELSLFLVRKV